MNHKLKEAAEKAVQELSRRVGDASKLGSEQEVLDAFLGAVDAEVEGWKMRLSELFYSESSSTFREARRRRNDSEVAGRASAYHP